MEILQLREEIIEKYHECLFKQYGDSSTNHHLVCGWSSIESQEARFSALIRVLKYNGGSIVDFGCGTGDLFEFLIRNYRQVQYIGLDSSDKMLKIARETHNGRFIRCGFDEVIFTSADYVLASGIFQFQDGSNPYYYEKLIKELFSKSRIALAVNFLSATRLDSSKIENELYMQPSQIVQLATSITPMWAIDHSYHTGFGDITMALFHPNLSHNWERSKLIKPL